MAGRGGMNGRSAATRGTDDVSTTDEVAKARPGSAAETCCDEPECRRHYPIGLYLADFSGTVYAVTRRRVVAEHEDGTATFAASERHDVTPQLREFCRRNPDWIRTVLEEETTP